MSSILPISPHERETFMDMLRGFAILGIFIANLIGFSWYSAGSGIQSPYLLPELDNKVRFLQLMFVEGKFYSIFSLLFGWGIALQIKRMEDKGLHAIPTVRRRLLFMLLFGLIHISIWSGDIVFFYALLSFLLLPLRKLSNKALLVTGVVLILSPIIIYAAKSHWLWLNTPADFMYGTAAKTDAAILGTTFQSEQEVSGYLAKANWWDAWKANISGFFYRFGYLFFVSRVPKVLGMFLIGYALGRSGFYKNIAQNKKILYWIIGVGLVLGLPANYYLAYYMTDHMMDYWTLQANGLYQTIAYALGVVPLAMLYVAVLMLLYQCVQAKKILNVIAPVGKMAFSNYMLQTAIGTFVFLGAGLGYIGKVGPAYLTLFGVLVFIGQVLLSHCWLRFYHYGPVEWLWRSATYKKWQPMRK